MKKIIIPFLLLTLLLGCEKDLLNQYPTDQISEEMFWQSTQDATVAVSGAYQSIRDCFGWDFLLDTHTDICYGKGRGDETGRNPSPMWHEWTWGYRGVNRTNVAIQGITNLIPDTKAPADIAELERLLAEAKFLRAMSYFRLVDFFGSVPYMNELLTHDEAIQLSRTPLSEIYDHIMADLDYAVDNLPPSYPSSDYGRATKWAALSYRGKFNLFWASWLKNERPQWKSLNEQANSYYSKAQDDFKTIMNESGHDLLWGGEPGEYHDPNYRQLFSLENEQCEEIIFSAQFHGPGMGLGNQIKAIFGSRQMGNNGAVQPTIKLLDLYLKLDGSKADPLIPSKDPTLPNSATNRESYKGRDWRMRASILWDGEKVLLQNGSGTEMAQDSATFMWGNPGTGHLNDPYFNLYAHKAGYSFRKWFVTYPGYSRYDTPQDFYLVRYADILLMYAECVNETNDGPNGEVQNIVNYIRKRGNITPSDNIASMSRDEFFELLVNERAVEFVAEGHRFFDIRRWRIAEQIWNNGVGFKLTDTWGKYVQDEFVNAQPYQFGRFYTGQIPDKEIVMNPKLTQNEPWL